MNTQQIIDNLRDDLENFKSEQEERNMLLDEFLGKKWSEYQLKHDKALERKKIDNVKLSDNPFIKDLKKYRDMKDPRKKTCNNCGSYRGLRVAGDRGEIIHCEDCPSVVGEPSRAWIKKCEHCNIYYDTTLFVECPRCNVKEDAIQEILKEWVEYAKDGVIFRTTKSEYSNASFEGFMNYLVNKHLNK